jgi:rubrerythrin
MDKEQNGKTGTKDVTYNLVSILYHTLQGADTCQQYIRDAEKKGNEELTQFFKETKEQNRVLADKAKELLQRSLSESRSDAASG